MTTSRYKKRIADDMLRRRLQTTGAVLIQGPKWCGKTTTAEQHARSRLYMDDADRLRQNIELAEISPSKLLVGAAPRLIDEWQLAPQLWDAIRYEVDHREGMGHFILTGSAVPADRSRITHSGVGRFSWLTMRTMSLLESGDSSGEVSMRRLFEGDNEDVFSANEIGIDRLAWLICRGGWPRATTLDGDIALDMAFNYYDGLVHSDLSRVDGMARSAERAMRILRALSRHQAAQVAITTLRADIAANEGGTDVRETVSGYIEALKKVFVVDNSPAWNPNLRSKTAIRTSDTYYFSDPSIGVAALGIGPGDLIADIRTMGLFFETLVVRDLRVYADAIGGKVYHYRDKTGLECDAVVHLRNGSYGLIEIKLGGESNIEAGVKTLLSLNERIDHAVMRPPSFMMVVTGTSPYAYRRKDGILVVPIGCLGA